RRGLRYPKEHRGIPDDRLPTAEVDLAEHCGTQTVVLFGRRKPAIPTAGVTEALSAELERLLPAVLDLPLVVEEGTVVFRCARDVGEQRIEVKLPAIQLGLEQWSEAKFVALAAVVRQLELGDEAHIDWVFSGLGQLELVLELEGIELRLCAV